MRRILIAVSVALMFTLVLVGCNGSGESTYEQITPAEA